MVVDAARDLWAEPRVSGQHEWTPRDRLLVAVLVPAALLEALLRPDVIWRVPSVVVAVVLVLVLPWRRTRPLEAVAIGFGTVTLVQLAAVARDVAWEGLFTMVVALVLPYSLCRWGSGRDAMVGLAIVAVPTTIGVAKDATTVGDAVGGVLVVGLAAAIGVAVRARHNARARELDQVKLREREQLARELHDTVAHHVSAIAVQAQAGRTLAGSRPGAALDALEVIEEEASRTLAEMRTMVGALRQGEEPDLVPQRGVTDIRGLARCPDRGPRVEVELSGALDDLRPSVDAALYRLAQESVTNALRHARHASRVDVSVRGDVDLVWLTVRDDGDAAPTPGAPAGFGLVGMAERAKLLGGSFEAGPTGERGWAVRAVLPKHGGRR